MPKIRQEVTFDAAPAKVYRALVNSAEHAAFTGAPAEISDNEGGTFSVYGGHIHGRHIALVPDRRIVQAWRAKTWQEGVFSVARFELHPEGGKTRLVFEQDGVPEASVADIDAGWKKMYWKPLHKYLAA